MNKQQLTDQMLNLQTRMEGLRTIEAKAFENKLKSKVELEACKAYNDILKYEQEMKDAIASWYQLYTQYLNCREKLNAIK
jgi:peroxiredoxin family protein